MTERENLYPKATRYAVPPGTTEGRCQAGQRGGTCTAPVFWIRAAATNARIPVDCTVAGGRAPTSAAWGSGLSHFVTCVDRDLFRRKAKTQAPPKPRGEE